MTVYVDELRIYPSRISCFRDGSCHMTADRIEELHAFALSIGIRRAWFQMRIVMPHYDLTKNKRIVAVSRGAVEVRARDKAIERVKARSGEGPCICPLDYTRHVVDAQCGRCGGKPR